MKRTKEQKGITLIALIITIVVLMVLAAVAISSIQNDGIIGHAQNAANKYTEKQQKEQDILEKYEEILGVASGAINYDNIMKTINHRGYNKLAPENTIPAYEMSKKMGFKYVEADVSFTSDGVAVLLHDGTIDRTARTVDGETVTGAISEMTYEQVSAYDFGIWKAPEYAGTKMPTFEEFISFCNDNGLYPYIELNKTYTEEQIKGLVETVNTYGMLEKSTWISFNPGNLRYVNNYDVDARIGLLVTTNDQIKYAKDLKTDQNEVFVNYNYGSGNFDEVIATCKREEVPLEMYGLDESYNIIALDPYVSGVTTDSVHAGKILYKSNSNQYEVVKVLAADQIAFGKALSYLYGDGTFSYGGQTGRAAYTLFDIPVEYGYIYKFEFTSTVSTSQVGLNIVNQKAIDLVNQNSSYGGAYNHYDTGWKLSGFEIEIPISINGSPAKAVRLNFRDTAGATESFITGVTISRRPVK